MPINKNITKNLIQIPYKHSTISIHSFLFTVFLKANVLISSLFPIGGERTAVEGQNVGGAYLAVLELTGLTKRLERARLTGKIFWHMHVCHGAWSNIKPLVYLGKLGV
jgi:hypothetical protein